MPGMGMMGNPWMTLGLDLGGAAIGGLIGGNGSSPMYGMGEGAFQSGMSGLGNVASQYGQFGGMVNPYTQGAIGNWQNSTNSLGNTLGQYADPRTFMNAERQTRLGAMGLGGAMGGNIAWNAANYGNNASRGLFNSSSGGPSSISAGQDAYGQGILNQQLGGTLNNIGQLAMNAPLQYGGMQNQLYNQNANQLYGMGMQANQGQQGAYDQMAQLGMGAAGMGAGINAQQAGTRAGMIGGLTSGIADTFGWQQMARMYGQQPGQGGMGGGLQQQPYTDQNGNLMPLDSGGMGAPQMPGGGAGGMGMGNMLGGGGYPWGNPSLGGYGAAYGITGGQQMPGIGY